MQPLPDIRSAGELAGKRVLVRAGLNVPIENGAVANDFRIRRALPTIEFLREAGARTVVCAHIGRGPEETLKPVADKLNERMRVSFAKLADAQSVAHSMQDGDVLLLENVRSDAREQENDASFARELAALADVYVNDAFAASHRAHASIVGVPALLPSYAGLSLHNEVAHLMRALTPPEGALAVLGGAKPETKEPLIGRLCDTYAHVLVAGALANDFYRAQGLEVGASLVAEEPLADIEGLLARKNVLFPEDVVVQHADGSSEVVLPEQVGAHDIIMDAGPRTVSRMRRLLANAPFVLWNGPLGNYEKGFAAQTEHLARVIAESDAESIVGGGDTIAAVANLGLEERFSFVSTGGGAMLQFLMNEGTLPGIEALVR